MNKFSPIFILIILILSGFSVPFAIKASDIPAVTIVVEPTEINHGDSATILWSSSGADSCVVNGGEVNSNSKSGTRTVSPEGTTTYRIVCTNSSGSNSDSATLTVIAEPLPSVSISAIPPSIENGGASILRWNATNVDSCVASGGWSGTKSNTGTLSVRPKTTTTYFITCINSIGATSDSASVTVAKPLPEVTLTVSKGSVSPGEAVSVVWDAKNSNTCSAAGGWYGTVPFSGSRVFYPQNTTTFSIVCTNNGGSVSADRAVYVSSAMPPVSSSSATPTVPISGSSRGSFISNCYGSPETTTIGGTVRFFGSHVGGVEPVSYTWSGSATGVGQTIDKIFRIAGTRVMRLVVTDAQGRESRTECYTQVFSAPSQNGILGTQSQGTRQAPSVSDTFSRVFGFLNQDKATTTEPEDNGESLLASAITPRALLNIIWYAFLVAFNIVAIAVFSYSSWELKREIKKVAAVEEIEKEQSEEEEEIDFGPPSNQKVPKSGLSLSRRQKASTGSAPQNLPYQK